jgi:hypothetical protein
MRPIALAAALCVLASAPSALAQSPSPLAEARACLARGDNDCAIRALQRVPRDAHGHRHPTRMIEPVPLPHGRDRHT